MGSTLRRLYDYHNNFAFIKRDLSFLGHHAEAEGDELVLVIF